MTGLVNHLEAWFSHRNKIWGLPREEYLQEYSASVYASVVETSDICEGLK